MINKVLIDENGNRHYWSKGDLSTHLGIIKENKIKKSKSDVKSNLGKRFLVIEANFLDNIGKIKKGAATANLKDIGALLVYSGISKDSIILEAGSGSGQLTILLSRFTKKVYSYEKNKNFYDLARKNLDFLKIKNVDLKNLDIKKSKEKNIDLIVLDLLDPWNYVNIANKALKKSGYLAAYLTNVNQINELTKKLNGFMIERIINVKEENWISKGIILRPEHWSLSHTAFLLFARKI